MLQMHQPILAVSLVDVWQLRIRFGTHHKDVGIGVVMRHRMAADAGLHFGGISGQFWRSLEDVFVTTRVNCDTDTTIPKPNFPRRL